MYNGIGLQTPRGSGTNGYVQRNMSFVPKSREKVNYKTEEDIKRLDALANKKPNEGILAHEKKRTIELKCLEMQELMEDQGYSEAEIDKKVTLFRQILAEKEGDEEKEIPKDEFGRPIVKESHQMAEANQEKNSKMREALGISQYFVEGSSLDPERKAKEAAAAAAAAEEAKKKYTLIPDSSSSSSPERSQEKEKGKKRKKKKSHSSRDKIEPSSKKKKSAKKRRKELSIPADLQKKKKSKKAVKDKSKYKNKSDATRKKHTRSSSSSSSASSESADDESSSRSTSRDSNSASDSSPDKHKSGSKHEKSVKGNRKRSTSSERIRYSKDARSRKDIYEAKKAKYKRKSARSSSSSSSDDSSPKQYYRLEPVLLKSKSKHKKSRQIIEIPTKSAFELKKYEKKKRKWESSSSSEVEEVKTDSKRRKRSESLVSARHSKHYSERDEVKSAAKHEESQRSYQRSEDSFHEKHYQNRSKSSGSQHKSHHKSKDVPEDECSDNQRRGKDRPRKDVIKERYYDKESNSRKRSRKDSGSLMQHNGHSMLAARSQSPEMDNTERERSVSVHKNKKFVPHSPPYSPVLSKSRKHILVSSPHQHPNSNRRKMVPRSPSHSPPKKCNSKQHKSQRSRSRRYDTESESGSPAPGVRRNDKVLKHPSTTEKVSKSSQPRRSRRDDSQSWSRSPSVHKDSAASRSKAELKFFNSSPSRSIPSDQSSGHCGEMANICKSKEETNNMRHILEHRRSSSPLHHQTNRSKLIKNINYSESPSPDRSKVLSPPVKEGMTVTVETCQISPSKDTEISSNRDSVSCSPGSGLSLEQFKKKKRNEFEKKQSPRRVNRSSPKNNVSSPNNRQSRHSDIKSVHEFSSCQVLEAKVKRGSTDGASTIPMVGLDTLQDKDSFTTKNNWSVVSKGESLPAPSQNIPHSSVTKDQLKSRGGGRSTPTTRDSEHPERQNKTARLTEKSRNRKAIDSSPSIGRSGSENPDVEKSKKRTPRLSRSRSSCSQSHSERSSRSHSYNHRARQSYSKSRSKSYSKSRSRSHSESRSKTRSKSRSKSHSRSRSKSYSRSRSRSISLYSRSHSGSYTSRSRSRSIARSPSIPRRRGSPSFLDKRRITS